MPVMCEPVSPPASKTSGQARAPLDLANLPGRLHELVSADRDYAPLATEFVRLVAELTGARQVDLWRAGLTRELGAGPMQGAPRCVVGFPRASTAPHDPQRENQQLPVETAEAALLAEVAGRAIDQKALEIRALDSADRLVAVAVPVLTTRGVDEACAALFALSPGQPLEPLVLVLELSVGHLALGKTQQLCRQQGWEAFAAASTLELVQSVAGAAHPELAARTLVDCLARDLGCIQVALGWVDSRRRVRLAAVSGQVEVSLGAVRNQTLETLLAEALQPSADLTGEAGSWTATSRELALELGAEDVARKVLADAAGNPVAVLAMFHPSAGSGAQRRALLEAAAQPLATCLATVRRAEHLAWINPRHWLPKGWGASRWMALISGALLATAALAWPAPARIAGPCRVEPVTRRLLSAPFEATLEQAAIEVGQLVEAGQLLAQLDGRPFRLELSALEAELARAAKQRDIHLAAHATAEAELARCELENLQIRRQLLEHHLSHLEVRSPVSGMVLSDSMDGNEGASLKLGQPLVEVAPLDQVRIEIGVPADQWNELARGSTARVALDALSGQRLRGQVTAIHPVAETWDGANVFVAEVLLDNPGQRLRPGMTGTGRIEGPQRPRIVNWLWRPWQRIRAGWAAYE